MGVWACLCFGGGISNAMGGWVLKRFPQSNPTGTSSRLGEFFRLDVLVGSLGRFVSAENSPFGCVRNPIWSPVENVLFRLTDPTA